MDVVGLAAAALAAAALPASKTSGTASFEKATFGGGCFWCIQGPFEANPGVIKVSVGYMGGHKDNPTYEEVSSGTTGHVEAAEIIYDPQKVSYRELVEIFWRQIDPTDPDGQFADRGSQYHTVIFYYNEEQKRIAEESKRELQQSGKFDKPIATRIEKASTFWPAEDYHQAYYQKNPMRYRLYKKGSGREDFIDQNWPKEKKVMTNGAGVKEKYAKPPEKELRSRLTPEQFRVTQQCGTEPPFQNAFWDNHREGIYVDVVSGEPLFSSREKFDSGTGWPSFFRPLEPENIEENEDRTLAFQARTEVRSKHGDSHLGHLFPDGPAPTGLRYCINSASLRFIPKEKLEEEGYGKYKKLFEK